MYRILDDATWQSVLEAVPDYLVVTDAEGRIRALNRCPLGYTSQQFTGRTFWSLFSPSESVQNTAQHTLKTGALGELEAQWVDSGRWHSLRISLIRDRDDRRGLTVHIRDVDDSKQSETERARLRARLDHNKAEAPDEQMPSQPRLDLMADSIPILISYVDDRQRYQYNNAAYERWFGTSRQELQGRSLEDVLGPEAYSHILPYVAAALRGEQVSYETLVPYKGAGLRRVVARYVPDMDPTGKARGFYALVEDVSAQREAEAALRQRNDELRELQKMEALGRLAGGIAHEFNNLLQAVVAGCGTVQLAAEPGSPVTGQVERISRAAQRGISLTRQLLSFSRQREPQLTETDMDALIGDLMILLEPILGSQVQLESTLNARCRALVDGGQIQQVLMNLAINARDAMPEGGDLRVRTERVIVSSGEAEHHAGLGPGQYIEICVADTGTGMDEATQEKIFDPFFTTKPAGKGTGLGLSTVYGIVHKLGGHIDLKSEIGTGTEFRIYLPCEGGEN